MDNINKSGRKNLKALLQNRSAVKNMHSTDVAKILSDIHRDYEDRFVNYLRNIPEDMIGEVIVQMPERDRLGIIEKLAANDLKNALESLETDDATDLLQEIESVDEAKAQVVMDKLSKQDREELKKLKEFDDEEAGAFMQTELFDVRLNERLKDAVSRLRKLKKEGELENIHQAYVVDGNGVFLCGIWLEDLITYDFERTFREIIEQYGRESFNGATVAEKDDIKEVIKTIEQYDLSVIPVLDQEGVLVGRITSDDIYDIIEEGHTEQLYNLAGVDDEAESEEQLVTIWKKRSIWLGLNLLTAILASLVIGLFEDTIQSYVALAILLPIVASMGGNAGMQSLTVVIRKLALGQIESDRKAEALRKESLVALFNGLSFAAIMGVVAYVWFWDAMLGVAIALAMLFTLIFAGLFGTLIPMMLKKAGVDPAVGSSVLLTTSTDIIGFFCFLGLATVILL